MRPVYIAPVVRIIPSVVTRRCTAQELLHNRQVYKSRNRTRTDDETMKREIMNPWAALIIRDKDRAGRTMARGW